MRQLIYLACILHAALAAPQIYTKPDGTIGVNFFGFGAEAGGSGAVTGNGPKGSLTAKAYTPFGANAYAGLGGQAGAETSGGLFAGANANPNVGANAILAGRVPDSGFAAYESHSYTTRSALNPKHRTDQGANTVTAAGPSDEQVDSIQKIKPPRRYTLIRNEESIDKPVGVAHSKQVVNTVHKSVANVEPNPNHYDPNLVTQALGIPIGILRSLQASLGGLQMPKPNPF